MKKRRFTKLAKEERQLVSFRIPKKLDREIEKLARKELASMNMIAIRLLSTGLKHYTPGEEL